jgi:hypothetical protein
MEPNTTGHHEKQRVRSVNYACEVVEPRPPLLAKRCGKFLDTR